MNPIRAAIAESLEQSDFTWVQRRTQVLKQQFEAACLADPASSAGAESTFADSHGGSGGIPEHARARNTPGPDPEHARARPGTRQGQTSSEVVYAITSLSPERASAQQLLELNRGHWRIENQLHWVRDVVMGEDGCRAKKGYSPQNLAALRNLGLSILRAWGVMEIKSTIRHFAMKLQDLLSALRILK